MVKTAGWESTRAMDDQDGQNFDENREDRAKYAASFGGRLSDYTAGALNINGYDGMATSNNHTGNNSQTVINNNAEFKGLDKNKGDNLIIHIPGTFSQKRDVDPSFKEAFIKRYKDKNIEVVDNDRPLENNMEDRKRLAKKIAKKIKDMKDKNSDEPITLTGHSHGGNVQKLVIQILVDQGYENAIDNVMFLGTPHRNDIKFNQNIMKKTGKVVNVFDRSDIVQKNGGSSFIGEIGPAKRTMKENSMITNVEVEVPNKLDYRYIISPVGTYLYDETIGDHMNMDSKEVIEQIKK